MSELTREQVELLSDCSPIDILDRYKLALMAHDAALRAKVTALEKDVAQLNNVLLQAGWTQGHIDSAAYTFDKLATANAGLVYERDRLKEALGFYADPQTYGISGGSVDRIIQDAGKQANAALRGETGGG
jgi:hypothetical protein